ncbi:hypothetical protein Vadar_010903 [Vaccinium darrowii]|uniref:Uncharacterized protein n=1 Tax=Vaccinium darrowii TaxID=229202 RepID=A0ACB7X8X4_9ERIC|nr:hypothetical protein Vadar_010903 [Vaccinium darrowii]
MLRLWLITAAAHNLKSNRDWRGMASGWGITGNKGRCYDFWMDFSECMSRCREPKDCSLLREDYLECLHHSKEFQRRNRIYKEEQRQLRAAARKGKEGGDAAVHSH